MIRDEKRGGWINEDDPSALYRDNGTVDSIIGTGGAIVHPVMEPSDEVPDLHVGETHIPDFPTAFDALKGVNESKVGAMPDGIIEQDGSVRKFGTGATRHVDDKKIDFEGHLSVLALREYGAYMHGHRVQADGTKRDSDNWQKGIPFDVYLKSLFRHTLDTWAIHRGVPTFDVKDGHEVDIKEALCGTIFNAFGYLHEFLKAEVEQTDG